MITTDKISAKDLYIDVTGMDMLPVTLLADYRASGGSIVFDAGCFSAEETEEMMKLGIAANNAISDSWKNPDLLAEIAAPGHACSCCFKKLEDGTVIMGRNMDYPSTFGPVIIFRTRGDGKNTYDTVNICYNPAFAADQIAELGAIPKQVFAGFQAAATDVVNSEGLYVQIDMREPEDCQNSSTNPESDFRVSTGNVIRLLATHCATIEETLEYIRSLDIYDARSALTQWSLAIGIMDKTGRYGVIEFVNNKVIWNEGSEGVACGHGNFYWAKEVTNGRFGAGLGRWRKLMEYYYDIESQDDMEKAMNAIHYSNLFTDGCLARDWKVDWITEMCDKIPYFAASRLNMMYGWRDEYGITIDEKHLAKVLRIVEKEKQQGGPLWTNEFLRNPANFYDVITVTDLFTKCFAQLPVEAQKMSGFMECSTISYTANNREIGYINHFFEMNDVYHIGLYETTIDRISTETRLGNA